jgi:FtsZ-binding cell division protein ZapB
MPNQSLRHLIPFPEPPPWNAPDPVPVMRREMKLLLIELNVLRVEVEQLREIRQFLSASIYQTKESRDQWRREAERLRALITKPAPEQMGWRYRVFSHPGIRFALSLALGFSAFSYCP